MFHWQVNRRRILIKHFIRDLFRLFSMHLFNIILFLLKVIMLLEEMENVTSLFLLRWDCFSYKQGLVQILYIVWSNNCLQIFLHLVFINFFIVLKALSKKHACIEVQRDLHLIYDCESKNRTKKGKVSENKLSSWVYSSCSI